MPLPSDRKVIAAARMFGSGRLMVKLGRLTGDSRARCDGITEAALGGPLVSHDGKFLGVILCVEGTSSLFLSLMALRERLEHFQLLRCFLILHELHHFEFCFLHLFETPSSLPLHHCIFGY